MTIEKISSEDQKEVIQDLFDGEYSYTATGEWIDEGTARIELHAGEYAVVTDELLTEHHEVTMNTDPDDFPRDHLDLYEILPNSVSVEKGDEITVSAQEHHRNR